MAKSGALNGKLVVLMGGSGFLGNYVAQALLERGARVRIASRNPDKAFKLKPLANLGQIQFARCNAADRTSVERSISGADAVVNLIGAFDGNLRRLMGEAPPQAQAPAPSYMSARLRPNRTKMPKSNMQQPSGWAKSRFSQSFRKRPSFAPASCSARTTSSSTCLQV